MMSLSTSLFLFEINCKSIFFNITGVAVGSGWQAWVAYINLGCYYIVGLPLGFLMGWVFNFGVMVCVTFLISHSLMSSTELSEVDNKLNSKVSKINKLNPSSFKKSNCYTT